LPDPKADKRSNLEVALWGEPPLAQVLQKRLAAGKVLRGLKDVHLAELRGWSGWRRRALGLERQERRGQLRREILGCREHIAH
jgi:hypothetical protein